LIGPELETFTYEYFPPEMIERLLRAVFLAHGAAWEECRANHAEPEVENLLPFERRGKLEGYMRDVAAQQAGVETTIVRDEGFWNRTELRRGPLVLTASSVAVPCGPVDPSEFRLKLAKETLADDIGQDGLWPAPALQHGPEILYALLLHSRSRWDAAEDVLRFGHLPGSAYLVFPRRGLKAYAHVVNLFEKFPTTVESLLPQEWDSEARVRYTRRSHRIVA
jgi:hypothetical protein